MHVILKMETHENEEECARSNLNENMPKDVVSKRPSGSPTTYVHSTPRAEESFAMGKLGGKQRS